MRADEILRQATLNGVTVSVGITGKLKAAGTKEAINQFSPILKENKKAILEYLQKLKHPTVCHNCNKLEVLTIAGQPVSGCVYALETGPWREEWHRLPTDLQKCISH